MSASLPNGSTIFVGTAYGSPINVSGITNANPAVASATGHGLSAGEYIVVTSGWSRLNNKLVRVGNVPDANSFEIEGYNTLSTQIYPAGTGGGSVKEVTAFTQVQQILNPASEGGEQQYTAYQFLEDDSETRIPTKKSGGGLSFGIADDPALLGYQAMSDANDDRVARAVRVNLSNGGKLCYFAYCSLNKTPTLTIDEIMACQASLSFLNEPVRYAT